MAYNINNFVRVVSQGDRNLQIIDNTSTVKYSINPYQVLNIFQNNNLLKINLKSGKMITLDFQNSTEAIESVLTLQQKIDELINITPFTIDKSVENWVEDVNLITPKGETLSIWGDLLPGTTSTYNIGSLDYEWHTLYVGSQSLVVGGVTISSGGDSIMMSSMNLGSMDDPLILTYDGLNLLINGTTSNFSGHFDTNKLVNGDLELSLNNKGTLNFPVLLPVSFIAVCDTEHIIGTYSPFIDENWWEFEVEFFVNADGSAETIINNIFPILTNPGYVSGNSFKFTVLDHGIPDFDFDILLDDVISAGPAGWTSNLLVSQPPTYPSTISSLGNLKFTSNGVNTFLFGDKFYIEGVDYLSKGGTLSQTLQIDSDNNDYVITGADNLILSSSVFDVLTDFISLDSNESGQILVDEDLSIMAGGQLTIIGSSSNITITGGQGLVYTQDYSPTFVDNSLVTKKFFLDNIGAGGIGPTGPTGPQGEIGATGPTGESLNISNVGDNRILTSDGTATGSYAESNLTFDGSTFTIVGTSSLSGHTILQQISETITSSLATSSIMTYDFNVGSIWYHGTASTDFTANFINVPTDENKALTLSIIISQGATGYLPNVLQIEGVTQSIKWASGTYSVSTNKLDIIGLSFLRVESSWIVLGQIGSFS